MSDTKLKGETRTLGQKLFGAFAWGVVVGEFIQLSIHAIF